MTFKHVLYKELIQCSFYRNESANKRIITKILQYYYEKIYFFEGNAYVFDLSIYSPND